MHPLYLSNNCPTHCTELLPASRVQSPLILTSPVPPVAAGPDYLQFPDEAFCLFVLAPVSCTSCALLAMASPWPSLLVLGASAPAPSSPGRSACMQLGYRIHALVWECFVQMSVFPPKLLNSQVPGSCIFILRLHSAWGHVLHPGKVLTWRNMFSARFSYAGSHSPPNISVQ